MTNTSIKGTGYYMSPELVDQLSRLFKNLSDICPTLIIAGNHDCNLNNRSRLDVLTPIVNNLNHHNLHYLKDSGIYKCADVDFVVWDCWTKEEDFILADDVEGDTKVVLFHGTVDRAETDLGFHLPSDVHIDKFKGYDLGLLGDIHKKQFLDKEERKNLKEYQRILDTEIEVDTLYEIFEKLLKCLI